MQLHGPLYLTDLYVATTFAEVFNAMSCATTPAQMHRLLLGLCARPLYRDPGSYFRRGFDGPRFCLRQRLGYRSQACFEGRLLTLTHYTSPLNMPAEN